MRKPECGIIKDCGSRKSEVGIKNKVDMRFKFHFPSSRHTNFTNFVSVEIRENLCPNFQFSKNHLQNIEIVYG